MNTPRHMLNVLRLAVALLFASALMSRCASMMTPTGGPRDSLPPVIVNMTPDNFATGRPTVGHGKIYIEFDEFVQLKDQQKEFFTSPAMKKKPLITLRGRGIVVQLRDTLAPNTTYALNFGSAIRDNNEGNPLYSMRYVFSTGPTIDSMIFSGYTADSYKADSVSKSFIWFFPADSVEQVAGYDSTIFKYKPAAIARAENNGIFIAQNLKPVPYRVYAVQDKNDNQLYDPGEDQIGFLEGTYNPAELPDFALWYDSIRQYVTAEPQLYLRMFTDKAFRRQILQKSERPLQHKALLYFGAPWPRIDSLLFDSIPADRVIVEPLTAGRDTLALWFDMPPEQLPDTIRGSITYYKHDSINRLQPATDQLKLTWRYIESKQEEKEREKQEKEHLQRQGEKATPKRTDDVVQESASPRNGLPIENLPEPLYGRYKEIKDELPEAIVLFKHEGSYYASMYDAETIANELNLPPQKERLAYDPDKMILAFEHDDEETRTQILSLRAFTIDCAAPGLQQETGEQNENEQHPTFRR